jgi:hypothetical protein
VLGDWVSTVVEQSLQGKAEALRGVAEQLEAQAASALDRRFSVAVREAPQYAELRALQTACEEAELVGGSFSPYRVSDLLTGVRRAIEATMLALAVSHPVRDAWRRVYIGGKPLQDPETYRDIYDAAAGNIGLEVPLSERLRNTRPNNVKAAAYPNGGQLRGQIVAALLAARDDLAHPFRRVAGDRPTVLHELDEILDACNPAAHVGGGPVPVAEALTTADHAFTLIGLLMGFDLSNLPDERAVS